VDLARPKVEVDVVVREDARKRLDDPDCLDGSRGDVARLFGWSGRRHWLVRVV
jgi:hypothetical protein